MNSPMVDSLITDIITPEMHIFGVNSVLACSPVPDGEALHHLVSVSDESSYECAVLMILLLYILWVGRSLSNMDMSEFSISNPFGAITNNRGLGTTFRIGDVILEWGLVVAMVALFVTRIVDLSQSYTPIGVEFAHSIISLGLWFWFALVCGGFVLSMVWGFALLNFMGYILRCDWIGRDVMMIKNRLLLMSVAWLLPVVLMSTLEVSEFLMTYVAVFVAVMFIGIYFFRTFSLFRRQKISILHWILYLCSVEAIPVSLMWVAYSSIIL